MTRTLSVALLVVTCVIGLAAQGPGPAGGQGVPGGRPGGRGPARDAVQQPQQAATGIIRGRIVTADTGAAIRRAQVRATSDAARGARIAVTDGEGRFELRGLAAGQWNLTASKAGFVTMRYGQRRPFEAGTPVRLDQGQALDGVDFILPRGAAITGRVYDEFGEPVANARLQVHRYQVVQGSRRLMPVGVTAQSDDTGAFRLYGLMPGDYYVSAVLRALPIDDPDDDPTAYAPTYYPGTGSPAEAQPIRLGLAEEVSISFGLLPVRVATISGRVIGSDGMPLQGGTVALVSAEPNGGLGVAFGNGARIRQDGSFSIGNVAPGSYRLIATTAGGGRGRGGADLEVGMLPLFVAGEDIGAVTIVTGRGATISGRVVVSADSTARTLPSGLQVTTQGIPGDISLGGRGGSGSGGRVGSDGTFQITGLFGPRLLRVGGLGQAWMLESVRVNGRDVTDTPVDFSSIGGISGVEIVVTNRVTEVTGTVSVRDGVTGDYSVVIFPDDERKWVFPSRHVRAVRPDQEGQFRVRGLPAGERYLAVALDYLEEGEATDTGLLTQLRPRGTPFTLAAGETRSIQLPLIER